MHLRNEKRYSPDDGPHVPRKRRQRSTKEDLARARLITTQNEQSPLFTRLPRELRDMIWEHAFGSDETTFHYRNLAIDAKNRKYPSSCLDDHYMGLPEWLLSCKTILGEALELFYRTQTYVPTTEYGRTKRRYKNTLLFNNSIKNVEMTWKVTLNWQGARGAAKDLWFAPDEVDTMFVRYLQRLRPELKDVKFTCEVAFFCQVCSYVRTEADPHNKKRREKRRRNLDGKIEGLRGCCRGLTVELQSNVCEHCELDSSDQLFEEKATVEVWAKGIVGSDAEVHECDDTRDTSYYEKETVLRTIRVSTQKS
ncbi:hypothetical protein J4E86_001643 [Alternaria arbusti]|uniref:uncharacterized protein n=1 Tax=Alternaria arbusti TaxID=232088 RepID=UPI00221FEA2A|nr:uncharacterized protein J4E86_001643 [Alternaria arbusti]KAI4960024.1 hypothetical protein J4E86_001643 [Alternaria arbusti]